MDHKDIGTNSSVSKGVSDGNTKFALTSPTVHSSRNKSYDVESNTLDKVETTAARPCAIIGPDRVLPPNPDDTMYLKKLPGETWPPPENAYRRPPEYPSKLPDYQPPRNISPRQTFQENMQRIMVPPTFSSMKTSEVSNLKNPKLTLPQEAKYCDVPYNVNSVNSEHKSVRNSDIPMSNVSPYPRNMPPPYGWPSSVNIRPPRPYGSPEFYQYQEFPSCAGPRPMTMIRPHRPLHEESAQVYSERLYQDANIRFKPYPTVKEKHQSRYDYVSNYPNTFHPPAPLPPNKSVQGHPYPVYPSVPYKYLDRRMHEPFVDGYHRSHSQQVNFNAFHSQVMSPAYGPIPGNCMQNKTYSDASSKPINVNKMQFENNNKVYLNLESRNKNYSIPENPYYNDMNHSQALRGEILLPTHSTFNIPTVPQHSIYRKDNTPLKSYDYNTNYRIFDQSVNLNHQRLPVQFSPNTVPISPDSNTSIDTIHTFGTSHEDCGYVSQSSTASIRSFDSGNIHMPHDIYRRHNYNNYDMARNTYNPISNVQISKTKNSSSNKKNLNVRQFLQMWNEGDEEVTEGNKDPACQNHAKKKSHSAISNHEEQLYVLGLVNVPNEELGKYDHIQKISKLPENIKGYNSIEILNQYEELLETPTHISNYNRSREYNALSKCHIDKDITTKMPRPVSPLDVEAKISQSVIHKEVGCNFEIKPCSPEMLNVEVAAPVQNILGERIIEKVVNPIITESPHLNRGENISQNIVNDAVNTASCKMVSNQYSSSISHNRIKTGNYSMQDLERNAGLCLASLPQLDNDIELNFPEINQQFIKANQIESNIQSGLQNLSHIVDLEQTQHSLPLETKNDFQQENVSHSALGNGDNKEFSKLSKYRKGRKYELNSSCDEVKQDFIKADDSVATLQRIDSVIIKNPDTNKSLDNVSVKLTNEMNNSFLERPVEPLFSSLEHEQIEAHELSGETAIDFSLSRTEEETAVSYLNAIDRNINQNLPNLEEFGEQDMKEGEHIVIAVGSIKVQTTSEKLNMPSDDLVEKSGDQLSDDYENDKQTIHQDGSQCKSLINALMKSPKINLQNKECKMPVLRYDETAILKSPSLENNTGKTINLEICELNLQNNNRKCLDEKILSGNPKETFSDYKENIKNVEPESIDRRKEKIDLFDSVKPVLDNEDKCTFDLQEKDVSNKVPEISFVTKIYLDTKDIKESQMKEIQQDIDNSETKTSSSSNMVKSNNDEDFTAPSEPLKYEELIGSDSNILLLNETNKEIINVVLEKSDSGTSKLGNNSITFNQEVNSKTNVSEGKNKISAVSVLRKETEKIKNTHDIISSSPEKKSCLKNDLVDIDIEIVKFNPKTLQDGELNMEVSRFQCLPDENFVNNIKTELCTTTKSFLKVSENEKTQTVDAKTLDISNVYNLSNESDPNRTKENINESTLRVEKIWHMSDVNISSNKSDSNSTEETKNESTQCVSAKLLDVSDVEYLSNEPDRNSNVAKDVPIPIDETTNVMEQREVNEVKIVIAESECLSDTADIHVNTVDEICLFIKNSNDKGKEFKQETKIVEHMEAANIINLDTVECECLTDTSCLPANTTKDTCLCTKNKTTTENASVTLAECRQATDVKDHVNSETIAFMECDISTSIPKDFPVITVECKYETEVGNSREPSHKMLMEVDASEFSISKSDVNLVYCNNSMINDKNQAITSLEYQREIEIDNNIQKESCKNKVKSECLSNVNFTNHNEEEFIPSKTSLENTVLEKSEHQMIIYEKDNIVSVTNLYMKDSDLVNDTSETIKCHYKYPDCVNNIGRKKHKELFSPWFQKLFMFTEGICKTIENKNIIEQDKSCSSSNDKKNACFTNMELVLPKNNYLEPISPKYKHFKELHEIEANLFNVMSATSTVLQSENVKKQITVQDSDNITVKYQENINEHAQFLPAIDSLVIKPQKILKRSLSESELEAYKGIDDIHFIQPCKRKKGIIKENQQFFESHMITNDICDIIQTTRRNSISTFYNEDNVYIVIENDLILTEENDSDKLCYSENTEESLTGLEDGNEINFNVENNLSTDKSNLICEYSKSFPEIDGKSTEDPWLDNVACMETVFSEDVAENIIIDVNTSPKKVNSLDLECADEESSVFYDSDHIDKLKSIYGRTICNDNTQLIETLYRTPQMNVNKTLYKIESQDPEEYPDTVNNSCLELNKHINCTEILESSISSYKVIDNKENMSENVSLNSKLCNIFPNFQNENDFEFDDFPYNEQQQKFAINSCELSNDNLVSSIQKENASYSYSSSPEVSSTTSEEKNSSILLKITNCNGSRVSKINDTDSHNKLSYKLTEKREYRSYTSNFSSSRTLITKAAQKYIPPLKQSIYDLKVKLPLPQHRLHTLKQLKIAKVEPKVDATASTCTVKRLNHDACKKPKPKFEDVLKSIDDMNYKKHKDNIKKGKISIPKVIIKKNENGSHYASSKTVNKKETYNPDLTGCKWQPWVFLEKNNFVDKMAIQNKAKAIYCHRKKSYVLLEKLRKYKSVYNANFVISQPKSETKGNLKYTIRLKHN